MSQNVVYTQDPTEIVLYTVPVKNLPTGVTVVSAVWSALPTGELVFSGQSVVSPNASSLIATPVDGTNYEVKALCTLSNGEKRLADFTLQGRA